MSIPDSVETIQRRDGAAGATVSVWMKKMPNKIYNKKNN
jgi:hypothetical protein